MDQDLQTVFSNFSDRISIHVIDLTDLDACNALFCRLAEEKKAANILCALTGGFAMGDPVHQTPNDTLRQMLELHVLTLVTLIFAAVPYMQMKGGGKIMTIGANAMLIGLPNMGAYCASKSAVMKLTESMSAELKCNGFNVNCALPTVMNTPQNRAACQIQTPGTGKPRKSLQN